MCSYTDLIGAANRLAGPIANRLAGPIANRLTLALYIVSLGACVAAKPVAVSPQTTLSLYRDALVRDDAKAAYGLLAKALQQELPYDQFVQQWQDTKEERAAQAGKLRLAITTSQPAGSDRDLAPGQSALSTHAVVTLPQGTQLTLEPSAPTRAKAKAGAWTIVDPDLQIIRAATPQAALRLLLAAAEQRNYPALLRLLTTGERQSLEAELQERIERLRTSLEHSQSTPPAAGPPGAAPVVSAASATSTAASPESTSDRVRIQYDPRFFIDLRREQDGWRIADFN
jgi:hypothetical protein